VRKNIVMPAAVCAVLSLGACSTGAGQTAGSGGSSTVAPTTPSGSSIIDKQITETRGPNGESPTPLTNLTLTDADIAKLQAGHYTAAELWHTSSAFMTAVQSGASTEFARLGITVTATANANMDAGTQANQVQTTMAKKPSVILSLPVDPASAAQAFQPAVAAGTKIVFMSNVPAGYTYGKDYSSIVTDDLYAMGKRAAEAMGSALGGKGSIGVIFYNASYYVTNERDAAFIGTLKSEYPNIKIVAEQGFSDATKTQSIASAMLTQHPNLDGIYVSYSQPCAEGVLAAMRTINDTHTKLVTLDIDDPVMVDMASGGNTVAVVADEAWDLGKGMADAAAYALLGKTAPAFGVAGAQTITNSTIAQGYQGSLHQGVPSSVQKVLG
jgi:ribose transport system substrate-binding protein